MSQTISSQHPAVVLRSNYRLVRSLLAIATLAIVALTVAVVVLAINNATGSTTSAASRATRATVQSQPTVQPNPDEQGVAVSPSLNRSYFYPGHF
jgi:hypothetical protein